MNIVVVSDSSVVSAKHNAKPIPRLTESWHSKVQTPASDANEVDPSSDASPPPDLPAYIQRTTDTPPNQIQITTPTLLDDRQLTADAGERTHNL